MKVTVETIVRVWDDDHGYYFEVGEDADGLQNVEIRYSEGKEIMSRISIPRPMAEHIARGILKHLSDTKSS